MGRISFFLLLGLSLPAESHAQADDFADGNDAAWQRQDPLGVALSSPMATFGEAGGVYRLRCPASPFPDLAGPGRVAALRAERYTDFVTVVDIATWDDTLDQSIGLLARVQEETGPGVTSGYAATWQVQDHDLELNLVIGEQPALLGRVQGVVLTPGRPYRLVFYGHGGMLGVAIIDPEAPAVPVAAVEREDFLYSEGRCGLLVFDASDTGPVDASFDNYVTSPLAAPDLVIAAAAGADGRKSVSLSWPVAASCWSLQQASRPDGAWQDAGEGGGQAGAMLSVTQPVAPGSPAGFFRLRLGWGMAQ